MANPRTPVELVLDHLWLVLSVLAALLTLYMVMGGTPDSLKRMIGRQTMRLHYGCWSRQEQAEQAAYERGYKKGLKEATSGAG